MLTAGPPGRKVLLALRSATRFYGAKLALQRGF